MAWLVVGGLMFTRDPKRRVHTACYMGKYFATLRAALLLTTFWHNWVDVLNFLVAFLLLIQPSSWRGKENWLKWTAFFRKPVARKNTWILKAKSRSLSVPSLMELLLPHYYYHPGLFQKQLRSRADLRCRIQCRSTSDSRWWHPHPRFLVLFPPTPSFSESLPDNLFFCFFLQKKIFPLLSPHSALKNVDRRTISFSSLIHTKLF